jgi:hypothetical protein
VNVKEELKVFRLENTNIRARIDSQCNKPSSAADRVFSRRGAGFHDSFYIVRGEPPDQLLAGVSYLLVPKKTLVSTLIRVRWTPEVQPADVTTEWRAIRGPIARHYAASNLDVNRNNYVIIVPSGRNPYPSFVAGPNGQSGPANIVDLYA